MRVPLEIIQLILQEAVDVLSYRDILQFRLVNSFFNEALWPPSAYLENKTALYTLWPTFPYRRKYIWQLIEEHKERPCFFSELIRDILDLPHVSLMSDENQHILIEKMIDAVMRSREDPKTLFSPHRYRAHVGHITDDSGRRIESSEKTLTMGLASSAILRGDHVELQALLDQDVWVGGWSRSLGMVPVDLAYKEGTREIIRTLVKAHCPSYYQSCFWWSHDNSCKVEMVEVLEKYLDKSRLEVQWLWFYCFNEAIRSGMLDVLRWLLRREGSSLAKWPSPWHKTPLFIALHDCPSWIRLKMVQLLLEHGVDPNGNGGLEISQTPLQRAIENGEIDIAMLLLKWGANPNTVAKRIAPLHMAHQRGYVPLVRCLFEHGARHSYQFKGKRYIVRHETIVLENIATLLEELGVDKALIHEQGLEYFILD
ncbi:hypothetical protein N7471_013597 [Penicillium samsonianum]|uniref:uncharacterized protein n=1 Tax=Penicillium samsonianum TaxID=1882272 RepID=UPI00254719F8|nr:uncharacterized protein N7471_013597 [Penicillium samsonianum]KAJ6118977.1 hypothetical protein N7471_013597 [Penicillium samsonianum]